MKTYTCKKALRPAAIKAAELVLNTDKDVHCMFRTPERELYFRRKDGVLYGAVDWANNRAAALRYLRQLTNKSIKK